MCWFLFKCLPNFEDPKNIEMKLDVVRCSRSQKIDCFFNDSDYFSHSRIHPDPALSCPVLLWKNLCSPHMIQKFNKIMPCLISTVCLRIKKSTSFSDRLFCVKKVKGIPAALLSAPNPNGSSGESLSSTNVTWLVGSRLSSDGAKMAPGLSPQTPPPSFPRSKPGPRHAPSSTTTTCDLFALPSWNLRYLAKHC